MKISDELIACYIDGTATAEERNIVRKYLCEHPEEYERIVCLMSNDTTDYLGEQRDISGDSAFMHDDIFSNLSFSAAAFAPHLGEFCNMADEDEEEKKNPFSNRKGLHDRLNKMCDELDDIL